MNLQQHDCANLSLHSYDVGRRFETIINHIERQQMFGPRAPGLDTPLSVASENEPMPLAISPGGEAIDVDYEYLDDFGHIGHDLGNMQARDGEYDRFFG